MPDGFEDYGSTSVDLNAPIILTSFSYKKGEVTYIPNGGRQKIFDIRKTVRNPWQVENLRALTGKDKRVQDFILSCPRTEAVIHQIYMFAVAGFTDIFIGCFGGKHRSVAIAELVAARLAAKGYTEVKVSHRDLREE